MKLVEGYEFRDRQEWVRIRWLATVLINVQLKRKDRLKPEELLPLGDEKFKKSWQKAGQKVKASAKPEAQPISSVPVEEKKKSTRERFEYLKKKWEMNQ